MPLDSFYVVWDNTPVSKNILVYIQYQFQFEEDI